MCKRIFNWMTLVVTLCLVSSLLSGCGQNQPDATDVPASPAAKIQAIDKDASIPADKKDALKAQVAETEAARDKVLAMNRHKVDMPKALGQTPSQ